MAGYLAVLLEAYHALPDKFNSCRLVNGDQYTNSLSALAVQKEAFWWLHYHLHNAHTYSFACCQDNKTEWHLKIINSPAD